MSDNAVGALAILCIFGLPVAAWIVIRCLQFVERLEMIRRGIVPPPQGMWGGGRRAYREWQRQYGAQPPGPGWGPAPGWQPQAPPPQSWAGCDDVGPQGALFKGIRLALIGFAITIGVHYGFGGSRGNPIILAGLIPMFVGIAQIIVAVLAGAQLPGVGPRATFIPPPGPPPPPPGPGGPPPGAPGASGPAAWQQPGRPRFEELSKPAPPPDVR